MAYLPGMPSSEQSVVCENKVGNKGPDSIICDWNPTITITASDSTVSATSQNPDDGTGPVGVVPTLNGMIVRSK